MHFQLKPTFLGWRVRTVSGNGTEGLLLLNVSRKESKRLSVNFNMSRSVDRISVWVRAHNSLGSAVSAVVNYTLSDRGKAGVNSIELWFLILTEQNLVVVSKLCSWLPSMFCLNLSSKAISPQSWPARLLLQGVQTQSGAAFERVLPGDPIQSRPPTMDIQSGLCKKMELLGTWSSLGFESCRSLCGFCSDKHTHVISSFILCWFKAEGWHEWLSYS